MRIKKISIILILLAVVLMTPTERTPAATSAEATRLPIFLSAQDVLPENLLKGNNYIIGDEVRNDGLFNSYRLTTPYGVFEAGSDAELAILIAELNAISTIATMDRQGIFGDALVEGVKAPVKGVTALVTDPVDTVKNVAAGAGQFFSTMGRAIISDDPYQDNVLKVAVGYDAVKRAFAYQLGINPYSRYEPLTDALASISQAAVAGGLGPKVAMAAVSHPVATGLSLSGASDGFRQLVRDNPPGKLRELNAAKLAEMEIPEPLVDAILNNYLYDPLEATLLVGELTRLESVEGRQEFLAAADLVTNPAQALLSRLIAQMMAGYHDHVEAAERIILAEGIPFLQTGNGAVILLLPADYVFPTTAVKTKLDEIDQALGGIEGVSGKELWVTGIVDERARQMFTAAGWKVEQQVRDRLLSDNPQPAADDQQAKAQQP